MILTPSIVCVFAFVFEIVICVFKFVYVFFSFSTTLVRFCGLVLAKTGPFVMSF